MFNQSLQRIRVMLQSLQHDWWISELNAGHRAELGVHWWGLFDSKISWRSSRPEEMSCCQAKKKKRLEEMLVGAEPPIIVPYPRNFVVKKNMGAFSTMIPLSDRDLNLWGLCKSKEGGGCAVQVKTSQTGIDWKRKLCRGERHGVSKSNLK